MWNSLIISILLTTSYSHSLTTCPKSGEDIYFIGNPEDIDAISNCTYLNSSLFITGDYNILDLQGLYQLEEITGYLVILDSHLIKNLDGLQNLKTIRGNELYLKTASVTFKYNNNFLDDENRGLCYTNLVDWSKITDYDIVDTNNGISCPTECHPECIGCFGPGPRLCQECKNHLVGNTCVPYDCGSLDCSLKEPTKKLDLSFERPKLKDLNVSWPELSIIEAGGNIQSYKLFRNDDLIYHAYFNDSGYLTEDKLPTYFYDTGLDLNVYHFYQIEYMTETGSLLSDTFTYNMYNWTPGPIIDLHIEEFIPNKDIDVDTIFSFKSLTTGVPYQQIYTILQDGVIFKPRDEMILEESGDYSHGKVEDFEFSESYTLNLCGFNTEYGVLGQCSILDFTTPAKPTTTLTTTTSRTDTSITTTTLTDTTTSKTDTSISTTTLTDTTTSRTSTSRTDTTTSRTDTSTTLTDTTTSKTDTSRTTTTLTDTTTSRTTTTLTETTSIITPTSIVIKTALDSSTENDKFLITTKPTNAITETSTETINPGNKLHYIPTELGLSHNNSNSTILASESSGNGNLLIILWIFLALIFLALCLVCIFYKNNEVCPEPEKPTHPVYPNPIYKGDDRISQLSDIVDVNDEFEVTTKPPKNPIYHSGSSIESIDKQPNTYSHLQRNHRPGAINNNTYQTVDSRPRVEARIIPNELYGSTNNLVDNSSSDEDQYDFAQERPTSNHEYLDIAAEQNVRPSSAYDELVNKKGKAKRMNPDITDESIGRRKGNLMLELKNSIKKTRGPENIRV